MHTLLLQCFTLTIAAADRIATVASTPKARSLAKWHRIDPTVIILSSIELPITGVERSMSAWASLYK
jgi:hypothetical protein